MNSAAERFWTIPNLLSLYRIVIFPYMAWLIFVGNEKLFSVLITVSLVTDILDGFIARTFNMQTKIGARLDSWADLGTYILAFMAIYLFKWEALQGHTAILILFGVVMAASYVVVFAKFGALIGLHTYLFKVTGYLQGAFIICLFLWGFYKPLYYFCLCWGIAACIEEIIIILLLKRPQSNVKNLYRVLKNRVR